jgi:hypothetical protein
VGCWVETCMVTGLPINYGAPVVGFLLGMNPRGMGLPARELGEPLSLPLEGNYDDYGGLTYTGSEQVMKFTEHFIQAYLVKCESWETKYGRKIPDPIDFKTILDMAERATVRDDELLIISSSRGMGSEFDQRVALCLVHRFAFDLAQERIEKAPEHMGIHEGILGSYLKGSHYGYSTSALELRLKALQEDPSKKEDLGRFLEGLERDKGYLGRVPEGDSRILREALSSLQKFELYLSSIRRIWRPQIAGKGSQHTGYADHAVLLEKALEFARNEFCEECGSEYCDHMEEGRYKELSL